MNIDIDQLTSSLPDFSTHEDASEWFTNRFGTQFIQKDEDFSEGKRVYFYHIVKKSRGL